MVFFYNEYLNLFYLTTKNSKYITKVHKGNLFLTFVFLSVTFVSFVVKNLTNPPGINYIIDSQYIRIVYLNFSFSIHCFIISWKSSSTWIIHVRSSR